MKFKLKYLSVLFSLFIILAVLPQIASASPIVWFENNVVTFTDFTGCTDNPTSPGQPQVKDTPISFVTAVPAGHQILLFVSADQNLSGVVSCNLLGTNWVSSVTDNVGSSYSRIGSYVSTASNTPLIGWEIWLSSSVVANAKDVVVHMPIGKLHVSVTGYHFSGIFSTEQFSGTPNGYAGTNGKAPFNAFWNNTAGMFILFGFSTNGGACSGNEPNCVFPATTVSGEGGYNENNITVACVVPPPGGCLNNLNSNGKPGGGDNNTATTVINRQATARITTNVSGTRTFFLLTNSPQAGQIWFFGLMIYPLVNPTVVTLPADNIGIDNARLNGRLDDLGLSGSVNVWFIWGDTTGLGNNTGAQATSSTGTFSQVITNLFSNHTYYFVAHAENLSNAAFANGSMLNFTTAVNNNLVNFIAYGWVFGFLAALILGMMGAYWIKRRRDER